MNEKNGYAINHKNTFLFKLNFKIRLINYLAY